MCGIYKIINQVNKKIYIGYSSDINNRWRQHKSIALQGKTITPLYIAMREFGINNFTLEIVEECDKEFLIEREIYWIQYYNSYHNGYNATIGGDGQGNLGEDNGRSKLTDDSVKLIIYQLINTKISQTQLAKDFNVSYNTINGINRCLNWIHLHDYKYNIREESGNKQSYNGKLTEKEVLKIINLLCNSNKEQTKIADDFNVNFLTINNINCCRTWAHLHNYKKNIRNESKIERRL